jgi:hypothetical protein
MIMPTGKSFAATQISTVSGSGGLVRQSSAVMMAQPPMAQTPMATAAANTRTFRHRLQLEEQVLDMVELARTEKFRHASVERFRPLATPYERQSRPTDANGVTVREYGNDFIRVRARDNRDDFGRQVKLS